MADIDNKYEDNAKGKFYVDEECIDCDLCRETAPKCFNRNDDGGYSFVTNQPDNEEDEQLCREAMEGCPVEAFRRSMMSLASVPETSHPFYWAPFSVVGD